MGVIVLSDEPISLDLSACKKLSEALVKRALSRMDAPKDIHFFGNLRAFICLTRAS